MDKVNNLSHTMPWFLFVASTFDTHEHMLQLIFLLYFNNKAKKYEVLMNLNQYESLKYA